MAANFNNKFDAQQHLYCIKWVRPPTQSSLQPFLTLGIILQALASDYVKLNHPPLSSSTLRVIQLLRRTNSP
jgi:hypothetical protein